MVKGALSGNLSYLIKVLTQVIEEGLLSYACPLKLYDWLQRNFLSLSFSDDELKPLVFFSFYFSRSPFS